MPATSTVERDGHDYNLTLNIGDSPEEIVKNRGYHYPNNPLGKMMESRDFYEDVDDIIENDNLSFGDVGDFLNSALNGFTDVDPVKTRQVFSSRVMDDGTTKHYPPVAHDNPLVSQPGHPCYMAHAEFIRARGGDVSDARHLLNIKVDAEGRALTMLNSEMVAYKVRDNGDFYFPPSTGQEWQDRYRPERGLSEEKQAEIRARLDARYAEWDAAPWVMGPSAADIEAARAAIKDFVARLSYWIAQTPDA